MNKYIINARGIAVQCDDLQIWGEHIEHGRNKYQLVDKIAGLRLSTVFLGLDHNWGMGEPLLWETMLFNDDERHTDLLFNDTYAPEMGQWRFSYMEQAYKFHHNKVIELKASLKGRSKVEVFDDYLKWEWS